MIRFLANCRGSSRGQDGFQLSLFGYDPEGDYYRLLEEHPGRWVNLAEPKKSLSLNKATGTVAHTGGELFTPDSESYRNPAESCDLAFTGDLGGNLNVWDLATKTLKQTLRP